MSRLAEEFTREDKSGGYVGILTGTNTKRYCLPKYYGDDMFPDDNASEEENEKRKARLRSDCLLICRAIRYAKALGYNADSANAEFDPHKQARDTKKVDAALTLIRDYAENGVYERRIKRKEQCGSGRINWSATVSRTAPLIINDSVIYPYPFRETARIVSSDIIARIQCAAVKECLDTFAGDYPHIIPPPDSDIRLKDMSGKEKEALRQVIMQRMRTSYTDRDIRLMKALYAYLGESIYYDTLNSTSHFHTLWEFINDRIWGNITAEKSKQVKYYFGGEEEKKAEIYPINSDQRIDTVHKDDENKRIYVFDSKYYVPRFGGDGMLTYMPAAHDIIKQVMYLEGIKAAVKSSKTAYFNAFLLPKPESDMRQAGVPVSYKSLAKDNSRYFVTLEHKGAEFASRVGFTRPPSYDFIKTAEGVQGENEKPLSDDRVYLIAVNANRLYERFLENSPVTGSELCSLFPEKPEL